MEAAAGSMKGNDDHAAFALPRFAFSTKSPKYSAN
jgi:hypothetical protein